MLILFWGILHCVQIAVSLHLPVYREHFLCQLTLALQMKTEYFQNFGRLQLKCDDTRCRTGREVKGETGELGG